MHNIWFIVSYIWFISFHIEHVHIRQRSTRRLQLIFGLINMNHRGNLNQCSWANSSASSAQAFFLSSAAHAKQRSCLWSLCYSGKVLGPSSRRVALGQRPCSRWAEKHKTANFDPKWLHSKDSYGPYNISSSYNGGSWYKMGKQIIRINTRPEKESRKRLEIMFSFVLVLDYVLPFAFVNWGWESSIGETSTCKYEC